jgi:hypothetical protein
MGTDLQRPLSELIRRNEELRDGIGSGMSSENVNDRLLEIENTEMISQKVDRALCL